jgi:hypothetical protein
MPSTLLPRLRIRRRSLMPRRPTSRHRIRRTKGIRMRSPSRIPTRLLRAVPTRNLSRRHAHTRSRRPGRPCRPTLREPRALGIPGLLT